MRVLDMLLVLNMSGSGSDSSQTSRIIPCEVLVNGYHKLPDHKMYWEAIPDTFV